MKITAIIVTYNGRKWVDRCLGSLRNSSVGVDVFVIDNGSTDQTVPYIKENYPEADVFASKENLGFAKANNIGIKRALERGADYVFLLNQDAWVEAGTLGSLIQTFSDDPSAGIAAPVQTNGEGTALDAYFTAYLSDAVISDLYLHTVKDYYSLPFLNAAAWLISSECIKRVGGFDTSLFFHYGEDINYCQRVLFHHYKIVLNTKCIFHHDREFRFGKEKEYRKAIMAKNPFYKDNVLYGDINEPFDINTLLRDQYKGLFLAVLCLSWKKVKKHRLLIRNLFTIKTSRALNTAGGLVWL